MVALMQIFAIGSVPICIPIRRTFANAMFHYIVSVFQYMYSIIALLLSSSAVAQWLA